jgi:hypothetical protein
VRHLVQLGLQAEEAVPPLGCAAPRALTPRRLLMSPQGCSAFDTIKNNEEGCMDSCVEAEAREGTPPHRVPSRTTVSPSSHISI